MTRRSVLKWVGIAAFGAVFIAGFVWPALHPLCVYTRRNQALSELKMFATAVAMYESDMGSSPADGLADCRDPAVFSSTVIGRLYPLVTIVRNAPAAGRKRYLEIGPDELCILGLLDPWGRPYRMALRPAGPKPPTPGQPAVLVMWSVGRNGIDEGGAGDDVADPGPRRQPASSP